jgi:hypothetical protein
LLRASLLAERRQLESKLLTLDKELEELGRIQKVHVWRRNLAFVTGGLLLLGSYLIFALFLVEQLLPYLLLTRHYWLELFQIVLLTGTIIIGAFFPSIEPAENSAVQKYTGLPFVLVRASLLLLLTINLPVTLKFLNVTKFELYGIAKHPERFVVASWPSLAWLLKFLLLVRCFKAASEATITARRSAANLLN